MIARWDSLKLIVFVNVAFTSLAVVMAAILAWENAASRNLALAVGTLIAAAAAFLVQLLFELQSSKTVDHVSTEFTIDRLGSSIRKWNYIGTPGWRIGVETNASTWLASNNPAAFVNDREMLNADFALFSLLCFLTTEEFDWQLRRVEYQSLAFGTSTTVQSISSAKECTSLDEQGIRATLAQSGNMFSGAPLLLASGRLRLPPKSIIMISRRRLLIQNPVCRISWDFEGTPAVLSHVHPGTGGQVPQLPSGDPRFETRMSGFNVEAFYFRWRSQHPEIAKYRDWVSRVLADAHEWFESGQAAA